MGLTRLLRAEFGRKSDLASVRANVLTETDRLALRDAKTTTSAQFFYNYFPRRYVRSYKKDGTSRRRSEIGA